MASRTRGRLKDRHEGGLPAHGGDGQDGAQGGGVEHRRLVQVHEALVHVPARGHLVDVEHQGPVVQDDAFGQAGGSARVHEDGHVVLVGFRRQLRRARRHHVLVAHVVRDITGADQHHLVDARFGAHRVDQGREESVRETDPAPRVLDDEGQLVRRQPQVEGSDDRAAQEAGVEELEELVSVEGHDREPVAGPDAQLAAEPAGEAAHPLQVLPEREAGVAIQHCRLAAQPGHGGQQMAVVDELLHAPLPLRTSDRGELTDGPGVLTVRRHR